MTENKKKINKQVLNICFLAVLIAITVIVIFTATDISFRGIIDFLHGCNPWWIAGAVGLTVASVLFESISLFFIVRGLGHKTGFYRSTCYASADLYYSAITPSGTGGQPASVYYMVKDGIGAGKASFGLVFNLTAYTLATIVVGVAGLIIRPHFVSEVGEWFPRLLIIVGFIIQVLLLAFFVGCMFWGSAVKKAGNGIISLLHKIHIIKKPDKWRKKLAEEIDLYRGCLHAIKDHPGMTVVNFIANLGQRMCHVLIPVFVILAAQPGADFLSLCAASAFIIVGYNSIPLPGGVGVYEYLYVNVYAVAGLMDGEVFILAALMVSRFISFYMIMIGCGLYTLAYHVQVMRRPPKETEPTEETEPAEDAPTENVGEEGAEPLQEEPRIGEEYGRQPNENDRADRADTAVAADEG